MSTYYNVACKSCKKIHHLGMRCALDVVFFGYSTDDVKGRTSSAKFIEKHLGCTGELIISSEHGTDYDNYDMVEE